MTNTKLTISLTNWLEENIRVGDTIYTHILHQKKGSVTRWVKFFVVKENEIIDITFHLARAWGLKTKDIDGKRAICVNACPSNTVRNLSYFLHGHPYDKECYATKNKLHHGYTLEHREL